jgi:capsular exopolysaccharide synthesis family protein
MTWVTSWQFARRWLWLLVVVTTLSVAVGYIVSARLPRVYEGTAKLLVTPGQAGSAASYNDVLAGERLTRTYAEVLRTRPIVEAASQQVGLNLPYDEAIKLLDVKPLRDTQLIQISARAEDPDLAVQFANRMASVFMESTQAAQSGRFGASKETLGKQVDQLAIEIADTSRRIDALDTEASNASRDSELARLRGELAQLQQSYAMAVRSFEDVRVAEARSMDMVALAEPAARQDTPVQPHMTLNVLLAGVVGLILALAAALVIEHLDDRLTSPERLSRLVALPTLGSVAALPRGVPRTVDQIAAARASSPASDWRAAGRAEEAYRLLRTNLVFAGVDAPLRVLLVTSSQDGEGKSLTAANLAVVMAQTGQRVVLVDADLRRPSVGELFGARGGAGLTSLLIDRQLAAKSVLRQTRVQGLSLVASGPLPPNPSELLGSQHMRDRLAELREVCDLVIVDSPPALTVSDPAILAHLADGTLLVVDARRTRARAAAESLQRLRGAGAHVLGAVLNQVTSTTGTYYAIPTPRRAAQSSPTPG